MSHLEFLRALINEQANARRERSLAHRIHVAGFAQSKTLADFDWQFNAKAIDRVRIETLAAALADHTLSRLLRYYAKFDLERRDDRSMA